MSETVLILGAGQSQVPIIQAADDLGLQVLAIDQNPSAPGFDYADESAPIDFTDIERAVAYAEAESVDGVVPSGDISLPTAGAIADRLDLPSIDSRTARIATTKELYRQRFLESDVPYPESTTVIDVSGALSFCEANGYPAILKPSLSFGGSRGVVQVDGPDELRDKFDHARSAARDDEILVEEFLDGNEHTIESLVVDGTSYVLATSDKTRVKDPYCVATSLDYPSEKPDRVLSQMKAIAQNAAQAIGLRNGATHIEVIESEEGLKVIDFGARGGGAGFIPSKIVPHVSGVNMIKEMVRLSLGRSPSQKQPVTQKGAVYRFFTPSPGRVERIEGIQKVRARSDVVHVSLSVSVGDLVPQLETQLDRVGAFVVVGDDGSDAKMKARQIGKGVRIETSPT